MDNYIGTLTYMMQKLKFLFPLLVTMLIAGCGTMMQDVIAGCDSVQEFGSFKNCIKNQYSKEGREPNHPAVRAFYAHLDVIEEAYRAKKITNAQARSDAYVAFNKTVQAANDRESAASANYFNALGAMQQQQQQQQQRQQQIRMPTQTSCYRNGQYVNCTTY
jgi:hypothetical protein